MRIKRWGMPYKGSKNKIAQWVVDVLPPNEHLYDLFCGGCAVTHCGLYSNKWKYIHINDFNPMMPAAFWDAAHGKFKNDYRWISREDFFRLKDTDAMVAMCYSFGKDWDAEKCEVVDYVWKPKEGETYYYISESLEVFYTSNFDRDRDTPKVELRNCFRTETEAQKYADKFKEILKERKL